MIRYRPRLDGRLDHLDGRLPIRPKAAERLELGGQLAALRGVSLL
jgi:hypothetical protein